MRALVSTAVLRTQPDKGLVALAREGNELAFEAIVERHRSSVARSCRSLIGKGRAEEAVQEALLRAWTSLQKGTDVKDLPAWLNRIARNASFDLLRRQLDEYERPASAACLATRTAETTQPEVETDNRVSALHALACVSNLPERQREALVQTAVYGKSHRSVANELGVTDGAVRQLVRRARVSLRAAASCLIPPPLAWAVRARAGHAAFVHSAAEIGGGAGTGTSGALVKGGAAMLATAAIFTGSAAIPDSSQFSNMPSPASQPARPAPAAIATPNAPQAGIGNAPPGPSQRASAQPVRSHATDTGTRINSRARPSSQTGLTFSTSGNGQTRGSDGESTPAGSGTNNGGSTSPQTSGSQMSGPGSSSSYGG